MTNKDFPDKYKGFNIPTILHEYVYRLILDPGTVLIYYTMGNHAFYGQISKEYVLESKEYPINAECKLSFELYPGSVIRRAKGSSPMPIYYARKFIADASRIIIPLDSEIAWYEKQKTI